MMNAEQLEAEQAEVNRKNEEYVKSLPPEDQAKFKAVSDAMDILTKAKVESFIFAMLPSNYNQIFGELFVNVHNFNEFNKPVNGVFTKENQIKTAYLNHALIHSFVSFVYMLLMKNKGTIKDVVNFVHSVYLDSVKWCWQGIEPKYIKDLKK